MMDGGEIYPQRYSRCLSTKGKLFGQYHLEFAFDVNKTSNTDARAVEARQVAGLRGMLAKGNKKSAEQKVRISDYAEGQWIDADDIVKKFEDIDRMLQLADAGKPTDPEDWLLKEQIEIAITVKAGVGRKLNKKEKILIEKAKLAKGNKNN